MIDKTYNQRISDAGIRTIRTAEADHAGRKIVMLELDGDKVRRPPTPEGAIELIQQRWGITA